MKICPCGGVCPEHDVIRNGVVIGFVAKCRACGRREVFLFANRGGEVEEGGSFRAEGIESHGPSH